MVHVSKQFILNKWRADSLISHELTIYEPPSQCFEWVTNDLLLFIRSIIKVLFNNQQCINNSLRLRRARWFRIQVCASYTINYTHACAVLFLHGEIHDLSFKPAARLGKQTVNTSSSIIKTEAPRWRALELTVRLQTAEIKHLHMASVY